ncbi:MAG: peptidase domain protein [Phycisphaerales bacterium]|nr:peptidase domain protein [Phycisphaerales bacterium]
MLPLEQRALLHGAGEPDPLSALPGAQLSNSLPSAQLMSPASAPQLSSHPGSTVKVYLDFTGAPAQAWGSFNATQTPAYDTDGDETSFSATELDQIREVWSRVAEKYSPFNVDVTTVDPGTYPYFQVARVVIGGDGAWAGGVYGGYSYVNGFVGSTSNTAWVYPKNLGKGRPKYVAEAAAHEAGHLFGLTHQSAYNSFGTKIDEYRGGRDPSTPDSADPIMGFSYYAARGVWAVGQSADGAGSIQNDLDILSRSYNGFGYRADDHGNSRLTADLLNVIDGTNATGAGVIETSTDADYFKFSSAGGMVNFAADVAPFGPTLDLALSLTDADGNVLASSDTASLGETISAIVPAGDYYLAVSSHGAYGDIGQYTISGSVVPEPGTVAVVLLGVGWILQRRDRKAVSAIPAAS